jgi:soluble lytic murein transglycosylase
MSYPLVFAAEVKSEAAAKGVDPFLVQALIREESRYNHKAISRSNALGLMQLLPATGYGVAKRLGVPIVDKQDFFKPAINIKLGTDYLSYVLGRYSGNALFAVASYNGGPNAVRTWQSRQEATGISDLDYFEENIPVRETRDYVRKVFGAYWNYVTIYGGAPGQKKQP